MFSGMHYVYEVYKTKSFSKAAKNLYISQLVYVTNYFYFIEIRTLFIH